MAAGRTFSVPNVIQGKSHDKPPQKMCRSIFSACNTHAEPVWSYNDQKTATNRYNGISRASAAKPSSLNMSRKNDDPPGGTCTKRCRPIQKTSVARNISTPGTPNAIWCVFVGPK